MNLHSACETLQVLQALLIELQADPEDSLSKLDEILRSESSSLATIEKSLKFQEAECEKQCAELQQLHTRLKVEMSRNCEWDARRANLVSQIKEKKQEIERTIKSMRTVQEKEVKMSSAVATQEKMRDRSRLEVRFTHRVANEGKKEKRMLQHLLESTRVENSHLKNLVLSAQEGELSSLEDVKKEGSALLVQIIDSLERLRNL